MIRQSRVVTARATAPMALPFDRMTDCPSISIVISTVQGWPSIRRNVAAAELAAGAVGGDVIITDGSGLAAPDPADIAPTTTWRAEPGRSVFQLRGIAYRLAPGSDRRDHRGPLSGPAGLGGQDA